MTDEDSFHVLIRQVRAGDEAAAEKLVREYEPEIRRAIRVRLTDPRLRRVLDSADVCQSVLGNFFVRAAAGQFDLDEPHQLVKLLATIARNRIRDHARRQQAGKRDQRRLDAGGSFILKGMSTHGDSPSQIVSGRELLEAARDQLSKDERQLADLRSQGREWVEIAEELGGSPEALRKKLARAMDRVVQQLGLDEVPHA